MAIMFKIRENIKNVLIIPLLVFSVCMIAAEKEDPITEITLNKKRAEVERQEYYSDANNKTIAGNKAFEKKEYQKAIDNYLDAIGLLKKCSLVNKNVKAKIASCKRKIAQSYEYWSRSLFLQAEKELQVQNLTTAIELCNKASAVYPPSKKRNDELIKQYKDTKKKLAFRVNTGVDSVIADLEQRKYNIALLMRQGKSFMEAGELDKARDKFEEILVIDPYNTDANDMIYRVNLKSFKQAKLRYNNTHNKGITEAEWKGVNSILPKTYTGVKSNLNAPIKKEIVEDAIYKKLRTIKIDHIEFEEVSIPTVIKFLKMRSKDIDPEKIGVNIFIRPSTGENVRRNELTASAAAPAPALGDDDFGDDDDDFGDDDDAGGATKGATKKVDNMPTVTMVVSDISLFDAIRYICRAANLKYRVEKYAVVIAPQDVPLDDVETRIYPIEHESIDSIGGGDTEAVKQHFVSRGVTFPIGAKIVYDSRISRLIATNTPENLKKIEAIIHNELNTVDPQVLIQAKFVEISQDDIDELGFDYSLSRSLSGTSPITGNSFSKTDRGRIEFGENDSVVRPLSKTTGASDTALSFTSFANGWTFSATMYALDQCDSLDILSTPRITTMNGQEATIRMIREVYYPSDWSEPETATTTGSDSNTTISSYVSSIPEFDDPTEEGIVLRVTPNVDADQYTITLVMTPVIQRFVDWTDYSYDVTVSGSTQSVTNTIKQPVIAARTVETTVSIYDGETIVLGGIIKDSVTNVDDNIPFLGRLPFIGRLFQTKSTVKEKKNLLIFLTCRLVNPDGTPIRERKRRGLPVFRR